MIGRDSVLYLSRKDVERINLPMIDVINALEAMFKEKGNGNVEMPPKPGIHTRPDAFIHAMPAYIPSLESAGMKWVSGYPSNQEKGLPYISGLLILNDPETGIPTAVMDCTWITAKRTGAATAVAAKYLARKESSTVGILACGVQGKSNLEALSCLFKITKVKAYDVHGEVAKKYASEMGKALGVAIEVVNSPEKAVRGLDMVVTSGPILKHPKPAIQAGWLAAGAFASAVDYDSYWSGAALAEMNKVSTDDKAQMSYTRSVGYFQNTPDPYADLGELAAGKKSGRQSPDERNIAINLGLALDDMATAIVVLKKAREMGIGVELPL
jgi:ornithine cyclodeaminase/alanine dehydrogenase-like protein (mu-crystallin family)